MAIQHVSVNSNFTSPLPRPKLWKRSYLLSFSQTPVVNKSRWIKPTSNDVQYATLLSTATDTALVQAFPSLFRLFSAQLSKLSCWTSKLDHTTLLLRVFPWLPICTQNKSQGPAVLPLPFLRHLVGPISGLSASISSFCLQPPPLSSPCIST